jgi:hypothetical protein
VRARLSSTCSSLAIALLIAAPALPARAQQVATAAEDDEPWLRGWLVGRETLRLRGAVGPTGTPTDEDVQLFIDGGARAFGERASLELQGALFTDLDGDSGSELASVRDTESGAMLQVYALEGRWSDSGWLRRAQVGRIGVDVGWPAIVDGAALTVAPLGHLPRNALLGLAGFTVFAFGGRTVHFYELDDDLFEDWLASAGVTVPLVDHFKLQLDYRTAFEDAAPEGIDHSYGGTLLARWSNSVLARVYARGLNAGAERVGARLHAGALAWGVGLDASVDSQLMQLDEVSEGGNAFFATLGASEPHTRASAELWTRQDTAIANIGARMGVFQRLQHAGEDGPFNRTFGRMYVGADASDLFVPGLFVDVVAEYHYARTFTEDALVTLGGGIGWDKRWLRAELGTSYQQFKYTYYRDADELADVRTLFASLRVRPARALRVDGSYTLEMYDRTVHTLLVSFTQDVEWSL